MMINGKHFTLLEKPFIDLTSQINTRTLLGTNGML